MRFSRSNLSESLQRFLSSTTMAVDDLIDLSYVLSARSSNQPEAPIARLRDLTELLQALVAEYRVLAELETRPLASLERVHLTALVNETASLYRALADEHDTELTLRLAPDLFIDGAPELVTLMLRHLLDNAIRYQRPGGQVLVVGGHRVHGGVTMAIGDRGDGLSPKRQRQLFLPFDREGKELCAADGMGMGLSIAETIARRHGARLTAHARAGRGSIFRVHWPPHAL